MKTVSFDSRICRDLDQALQKEWLETNGLGAVASSTVAGAHTRRSHGLLAVSSDPCFFLNHLDETLFIDETAYPLATRLYERTAFPEGFKHLSEFHLTPFPSWIFKIGDVVLMKSVMMVEGEETVFIRYQLLGGNEVLTRLEVRPLVAVRSADSLMHRSPDFKPALFFKPGRIGVAAAANVPNLFFYHNAAIVDQTGVWFERIQYSNDRLNGFDSEEDLYSPFCLNYTFLRGLEVFLCASANGKKEMHPDLLIASEEERRKTSAKNTPRLDSRFQLLRRSASSFLISDSSLGGTVNGRPRFSDSAREALFAFHGLLLVTGKTDHARRLLICLAKQMKNGLLVPNAAIDLPLWFIYRVFEYLTYSDDLETVGRTLFPISQSIIEAWKKGNERVRVAADGLVETISNECPLTWMDAKAGNSAATLRKGKPVEIQALWYSSLCALGEMAGLLGLWAAKSSYEWLAGQAKKSFNEAFWNGDSCGGFLLDGMAESTRDASFRPNQLFALGLAFPILEEKSEKWNSVLNLAKKYLLTPYGLRTLAPHEPDYRGRLEGDPARRERAVHQGTVWTHLLVPYAVAFLRANGYSKQSKEELFSFLSPLWQRLESGCFGHIPEMFDGDFPHESRGSQVSASALGACLELYELLTDIGTAPKTAHTLTLR